MEELGHHRPVMVDETIKLLHLKKGYKVLDATVGCGGHASFILEKIKPDGFLIGIDADEKSLKIAKKRLIRFENMYTLIHGNFRNLDKVLLNLGIEKIDAALFDLGISSYQIEDATRGFSFERDAFLDMRMDQSSDLRAYDIVNRYRREDLEKIIRDFGEERWFKKIAGYVLEERKKIPIKTTLELSNLIKQAVGRRYKSRRIHPATRTFQALRIAVNGELDNLNEALVKVSNFLGSRAMLCVISFHSLEDRIAKVRFTEFEKMGLGRVVTKKPIAPTEGEIKANPRSRSAKLRVFEKRE